MWHGLEADLGSPEKEWERKGSSEESKTEQKAGADYEVKVGATGAGSREAVNGPFENCERCVCLLWTAVNLSPERAHTTFHQAFG